MTCVTNWKSVQIYIGMIFDVRVVNKY